MLNNDSSTVELTLASGILVLGFALVGIKRLLDPRTFTLHDLTIVTSAAFFGLGPWVAYFYGDGTLPREDLETLTDAYLTVGLFLMGVFSVAWVTKAVLKTEAQHSIWGITEALNNVKQPVILFFFVLAWGIRIFMAVQFGIFFAGRNPDVEVPYWVFIAQGFADMFSAGCLLWASQQIWRRNAGSAWTLCFVILGGSVFWSIAQGRRTILFNALVIFFCFWVNNARNGLRVVSAGVGMACLLQFVIFPTFFSLRMSSNSNREQGVEGIYSTFENSRRITSAEIASSFGNNMAERPLIVRFICEICESERSYPVMGGEAVISTVLWALPASLFPQKRRLIKTEQLIQLHFRRVPSDTSITWPAMGCADFGVVGGFVAGVFLGLLLSIAERWNYWIRERHPFVAASTIGSIAVLICFVEEDPVGVLCVYRNAILFYGTALLISALGLNWTRGDSESADDEELVTEELLN